MLRGELVEARQRAEHGDTRLLGLEAPNTSLARVTEEALAASDGSCLKDLYLTENAVDSGTTAPVAGFKAATAGLQAQRSSATCRPTTATGNPRSLGKGARRPQVNAAAHGGLERHPISLQPIQHAT